MSLNTLILEENKFLLKPECFSSEAVENLLNKIKNFINSNNCQDLTLDLCGQNFIYATQLGILTSSYHFIKYIDGKVNIIVDSEETRKSIEMLQLSNVVITAVCSEDVCEIA